MDSSATQKAWSEQQGGAGFPLLADFHPKGEVCRMYGVYNEDRGTAFRSSFVIDPDGVIRDAIVYERPNLPDPPELLEKARALKT